MTTTDCLCAIAVLLAFACFFEGLLAQSYQRSAVLWWMLTGLLIVGAVIVRLLGGW